MVRTLALILVCGAVFGADRGEPVFSVTYIEAKGSHLLLNVVHPERRNIGVWLAPMNQVTLGMTYSGSGKQWYLYIGQRDAIPITIESAELICVGMEKAIGALTQREKEIMYLAEPKKPGDLTPTK